MSYSTPDTSHLTAADFEHIYEPAEDSFLMLDSLEKDVNLIINKRPQICVEIGTGSGICITFLAKLIGKSSFYLCTDINPKAAEIAVKTAKRNDVTIDVVVGNLLDPLRDKLTEKIDVLLFNPPYVVTPSEEVGCSDLASTWAGGEKGREVMDKLFPHVADLLAPNGLFYLLIIKENDEKEIMELMSEQGLDGDVVMRRKSGPEFLSVLRFTKVS